MRGIFLPYKQAFLSKLLATVQDEFRIARVKVQLSKCIPATQEHPAFLMAKKQKQNSPKYSNLPDQKARLRKRTRLENKREGTSRGRWQMVHQVDFDSPQNRPKGLVDQAIFSSDGSVSQCAPATWPSASHHSGAVTFQPDKQCIHC